MVEYTGTTISFFFFFYRNYENNMHDWHNPTVADRQHEYASCYINIEIWDCRRDVTGWVVVQTEVYIDGNNYLFIDR